MWPLQDAARCKTREGAEHGGRRRAAGACVVAARACTKLCSGEGTQ
jgi:hypothetical protein